MKTKIILLIIAFSILTGNCKKNQEKLPDDIYYNELNIMIAAPENDSISGACRSIIFYFSDEGEFDYQAKIRADTSLIVCDGYYSIMVNSQSSTVTALSDGDEINAQSNWTRSIVDLSLDQFAGKGEKYIGYKSTIIPSYDSFYGWIKIKLSIHMDTLTVIGRATNNTEGNSILAGQTD